MERETKKIDLPSGGHAEILTRWTFDEYLSIEAANLKMAKRFDVGGGETSAEIDHEAMRAATMTALKLAIKKLVVAGAEVPVNEQTLGDLDMDDGLALRAAVNAIQGGTKKK